MSAVVFLVQVVPPALFAAVCTAAGIGLLSARLPPGLTFPMALLALLFFIGAITFKTAPGWNAALMFSLAFLLGALFGGLSAEGRGSTWLAGLGTALVILLVAALLGHLLRGRLRPIWLGLWGFSWAFVAAWAVLILLQPPVWFLTVWGFAGLAVFGGVAVGWFAELGSPSRSAPGSALALDLYILGLNLTLSAGLVVVGMG